MAELKTKPNDQNVSAFLNSIGDERKRQEAFAILSLMEKLTKSKPQMWGPSIVGFGRYHYRYESGREGDWFLTGFSPRRQNLTVYIMSGFRRYEELMAGLGKYKTGKSCLYLNRLTDVDIKVLEALITESIAYLRSRYGAW
jgi:hypothetical protein